MIFKIKLLILLVLLNIVITNNNIKINYNINIIKMKDSSKKTTINTTNTTNTSTTNTSTTKTKTKKEKSILKNNKKNNNTVNSGITGGTSSSNNDLRVIEVAKEWVLNKEDQITKETSMFQNITEIMKKKLANVSLRPNTVHLVIKYIMELIEETPIKGVEQKEFALKVMRELFKDLTEGEDEIVLLKLLDDGSISNLIDLVVDATNGKINVNAAIETSVQCVTTCLPLCFRKSKNKNTK